MIKMNVGIIGGTDGLGKTLVYYFRDEFSVFITGRDHVKGKEVADELNVSYIESNAGPYWSYQCLLNILQMSSAKLLLL